MKRSDKVITLANLQKCVKIDKKSVHVDPNTLFTRLVLLLERYEDVISYFKYELTAFPTSLFKNSQMRKTNKAALDNHLISDVQMSHVLKMLNMLDSGDFLHRVKWPPNATYKEMIMQYMRYVKSKYGICCIVLDGYSAGPAINDHGHVRRKTSKSSADIKIEEKLLISVNQ